MRARFRGVTRIHRRRPRDERGAAAAVVGVVLPVLLIMSAFVVDVGMLRVARRDMQALADLAALDLARELDGRTVQQLRPHLPRLLVGIRRRNPVSVGAEPVLAARLGELDPSGRFRTLGDGAVPTAVEVTAATMVPFAFSGVTGERDGDTERTAVAEATGGACFQLGSFAAHLDTADSPLLGPLLGFLGSGIQLTVADYRALAAADVDLVSLLGVDLGAGTLEELVDGSRLIGLGDFYLAVAEVLERESGMTAQVGLLRALAVGVGGLGLAIPIADLLSLGTGGAAGLDATLNVLDLVTAAAAVATGQHAVDVPGIGVDLGPLARVAASLSVIEPPTTACGRANDPRAVADSAAVRLGVSARAADLDLGDGLRTRVDLSGDVRLASAVGRLTDLRCRPPGITVDVSDGLLTVDLRLDLEVTLLGIPVVRGPIRLTGSRTSAGRAVVDILTPADYDRPVRVGGGSSGLPALDVNSSGLRVLGLPLGWALDAILRPLLKVVVNPLVKALDEGLLSPLFSALGLDISGADVFARPKPTCALPALRG